MTWITNDLLNAILMLVMFIFLSIEIRKEKGWTVIAVVYALLAFGNLIIFSAAMNAYIFYMLFKQLMEPRLSVELCPLVATSGGAVFPPACAIPHDAATQKLYPEQGSLRYPRYHAKRLYADLDILNQMKKKKEDGDSQSAMVVLKVARDPPPF